MVGWNEDKSIWTPLTTEKRVIIEVIGGDADGLVLDSKSPNRAEWQRVETILWLTENCEIGKGMQGIALMQWDDAQKQYPPEIDPDVYYQYFIVERLDEGDEVLIRMKYNAKKLAPPAN